MAIEQVKIRARIVVGSITVETPYIQSFNVRKERGKISTFDASLKVQASENVDSIIGDVQIYAGRDSASNLIFTGVCRSAKISPCYDDPAYFILSISGCDKLINLQGKKFTRRCRAIESTWCAITGVVRPGLRSGKLAYTNENILRIDGGKTNKEDGVTGTPSNSVMDKQNTTIGALPTRSRNLMAIVEILPKSEETA